MYGDALLEGNYLRVSYPEYFAHRLPGLLVDE